MKPAGGIIVFTPHGVALPVPNVVAAHLHLQHGEQLTHSIELASILRSVKALGVARQLMADASNPYTSMAAGCTCTDCQSPYPNVRRTA
jgi:hypothetical protein